MSRKNVSTDPQTVNATVITEDDVGDLDVELGGVLAPQGTEGLLQHDFSVASFLEQGFSEERTLKICATEKGGVPAYLGQLIGAGPDVELNEIASKAEIDPETGKKILKTIPTWQFHPVDPRTLQPILKITDTLICPHQLDQICKRLASLAQSSGKAVQAIIKWDGIGANRLGQPLNKYRALPRVVE